MRPALNKTEKDDVKARHVKPSIQWQEFVGMLKAWKIAKDEQAKSGNS